MNVVKQEACNGGPNKESQSTKRTILIQGSSIVEMASRLHKKTIIIIIM